MRGPASGAPARRIIGLLDREPTLFAAYERIRVDAQEESIRIIADRLGTDDLRDLRPAVVVEAAAGVLTAALRAWARSPDDRAGPNSTDGPDGADGRNAPDNGNAGSTAGADLADLVERAYDALTREAASAAAHRTTDPSRTTDQPRTTDE